MRILATVVLLGLTTSAHADERDSAALFSVIQNKDAVALEAAARKLPLPLWQIWFDRAECQKEFGTKGASVAKDRLPAFLDCLAGLGLRAEKTGDYTYEPGVSIKPMWRDGKLMALVGVDGKPGVPTVTNAALATNLTRGSLEIAPDKTTLATIKRDPSVTAAARLLVCIDVAGKVTSATVSNTSVPSFGAAIVKAAKAWRFKPFKRAGKKVAVCAQRQYAYPEGRIDLAVAPPPPPPPPPSYEGRNPGIEPPPAPAGTNISPVTLEALRTAGDKVITPDDKTKVEIQLAKKDKIVGSYKLCVADTGKVTKVTMLKSTGFPDYDAKIIRTMNAWAYKPYAIDGKPVPVCSAVTFIYTQR